MKKLALLLCFLAVAGQAQDVRVSGPLFESVGSKVQVRGIEYLPAPSTAPAPTAESEG